MTLPGSAWIFSQAKFIGPASQFKDAGEITKEEFRDKYTVSWNQLFIDEQKNSMWLKRCIARR